MEEIQVECEYCGEYFSEDEIMECWSCGSRCCENCISDMYCPACDVNE